MFPRPPAAADGDPPELLLVEAQDAIKGASEVVDVVRFAKEAVAVLSDELGYAENSGGDGRRLERHRLREDDGGGLYV